MYPLRPTTAISATTVAKIIATQILRDSFVIASLLINSFGSLEISQVTAYSRPLLCFLLYETKRRNPSVPFVPPNPNELESAISTLPSRALFGT